MEYDPLVASNYARALLGVLQKQNTPLEDARVEARALSQLVEGDSKLRVFLVGPQFREETKTELFSKVFKESLSTTLFQYVLLLLKRDRIEYLSSSLEVFDELVKEALGFKIGCVTTAVELNEDAQKDFQTKLESFCKVKFDLQFAVDERVIGGVRVKYGDTLIDTTIENYLAELRENLSHVRIAS